MIFLVQSLLFMGINGTYISYGTYGNNGTDVIHGTFADAI